MPTYLTKMPDGTKAFIRGNLGPRCRCGDVTSALCDFPVGNGKTCDAKLCNSCGHHVGPDTDYCADHYAEWVKFKESGQAKGILENVVAFKEK